MRNYTGASVRLIAVDVLLVLGGATNFYWGVRPIFCMENLIFHLKKGYSAIYWG